MSLRPPEATSRPQTRSRLDKVLLAGLEDGRVAGMTATVPPDSSSPAAQDDSSLRIESATRNIIGTIQVIIDQSTRAWRPPSTTVPAPIFPASSVPVYVAVHALKHRQTMGLDVPKITSARPTIEDNEVRVSLEMMDDERLVDMIDKQLEPEEQRFFFQPVFPFLGDPAARTVDATLYCLNFKPEEILDVRTRARAAIAEQGHLVLVVVSDDSAYEDLSIHLAAPTALNADPPKPNMMALPLDAFVADAPTKFIAPRVVV